MATKIKPKCLSNVEHKNIGNNLILSSYLDGLLSRDEVGGIQFWRRLCECPILNIESVYKGPLIRGQVSQITGQLSSESAR